MRQYLLKVLRWLFLRQRKFKTYSCHPNADFHKNESWTHYREHWFSPRMQYRVEKDCLSEQHILDKLPPKVRNT